MATWYWVGTHLGTWDTATNWNRDTPTSGITGLPTNGDAVIINKSIAGDSVVNVNTTIPVLSSLTLGNLGATPRVLWYLAGNSYSGSGVAWPITASTQLSVESGEGGGYANTFTGSGPLVKRGSGTLIAANGAAGTTYGSVNISLDEGGLLTIASNRLGTGTITMAAGTQLSGFTSAVTLPNPLIINGNVTIGSTDVYTGGYAALTLSGTVNLGSQNNTLTITNPIITTGVISGTAGFTKAGTAQLTLTGTNAISGPLTVSAGTLQIGNGAAAGSIDSISGVSIAAGANFYYGRSDAKTWSMPITTTNTSTFGVNSTATLTLAAGWLNTNSFTGNLYIGSTGGLVTNESVDVAFAGFTGTGAGAWTKNDAPRVTLTSGGNSGSPWNINAGEVVVNGALTGTAGMITVASGAALTVAANVVKPASVNGTYNQTAGNYTGALGLNGTATISGGSVGGTLTTADAAGKVAKVTVSSPGSISLSTVSPWNIASNATSRAAIYQYGNITYPDVPATTHGIQIGANAASTSYAYWYGKSGTLTVGLNSFLIAGAFYPGSGQPGAGGPAVVDFVGATLNQGRGFGIGNSPTNSAVVNFLTGAHTHTQDQIGFGGSTAATTQVTGAATSQQRMTLQGATTTYTSSGGVAMHSNATGALCQMNIRDGASGRFTYFTTAGASPKEINLINGGKLALTAGSSTSGGAFKLTLYGTGNKIGSAGGTAGTLVASICGATGNGVASIPIIPGNEGADYIGAPVVVLSGGGGTGASARAVWDETTKKITSFEITNPGVNYTSAPTVTLSGATLANSCCTSEVIPGTPTLAANSTDDSIEKVDTGTLTLVASNTNTGTYTVSAGTLRIGNAGTTGTLGNNDASNVVVGTAGTLAFGRSDAKTYSNLISGDGTIAVNGGARVTLPSVNTFTSAAAAIAISTANSILRVTNNDSIGQGTTFGITVASGTAFEIDGTSGNLTGLPAKALALNSTGISSGGGLRNIAGDNTYSGVITLTGSSRINSDAGTLALTSASSITGSGFALSFGGASNITVNQAIATAAGTVTKDGAGFTELKGVSSYTGVTTVSAGTLGYTTAAAAGSASSFGQPAAGANAIVGIAGNAVAASAGGIRFTGTADQTFSRTVNITGTNAAGLAVRIEASSNTSKVTHSAAFTNTTTNQPRTYQFGGTGTTLNTVSFLVANNGTGAVGIAKAEAGRWVLSNTGNTYTGATTVNAGTLGLSVATWAAGAKVTSTSTVTVNAGAKIQTFAGSGGSAQRGRHTYSNLTFAANGRIRIGG